MIKKFSLPGYYSHFEDVVSFLNYYYTHPYQFYKDRVIDSVYGSHPNIIWAGGREPDLNKPYIHMNTIIREIKRYPIELWHVCTNCLINDTILHDYRTNYFMHEYLRPNDKLIVNHPLLISYLKDHYPNNDIVYSTTLNLTDADKMNEISKDNMYCLTYNYNNNNEFLNKLKYKHNIEILLAEPCAPNCPHRKEHQILTSKAILINEPANLDILNCPLNQQDHKGLNGVGIFNNKNSISNERIEELAEMGFNYFKISGRGWATPMWIEVVIYYLALPEYINEVRMALLSVRW